MVLAITFWFTVMSLEDLHIEVSVPSQETERSCICVLAILTLSVIFQLDLTVSENFTKSSR